MKERKIPLSEEEVNDIYKKWKDFIYEHPLDMNNIRPNKINNKHKPIKVSIEIYEE